MRFLLGRLALVSAGAALTLDRFSPCQRQVREVAIPSTPASGEGGKHHRRGWLARDDPEMPADDAMRVYGSDAHAVGDLAAEEPEGPEWIGEQVRDYAELARGYLLEGS